MKVMFLCQLPPPIHGASAVNQSIKESKLINSKIETRYINISPASDIGNLGRVSLRKLFVVVAICFKVFIAYLGFRPNKVYITLSPVGIAFFKDALLALMLKMFGVELIFHLHGKGLKEYSNKNAWLKSLYKLVFTDVDVIHLSEGLYTDIDHLVPRHRFYAVNNGINMLPLNKEKEALKFPIRFLYLSNLVREKGAMELLEACENLQNSGAFEVVFAGKYFDNEFKDEFQCRINNTSLKNISVLGGVYGADKIELLKSSDVMVLPTYYSNECFPLALIEAMASGMAIISTPEGAIPDMVEDGINGILVEQKDFLSLSNAMKYFVDNPDEIVRMGREGKERFKERYTFEIFERRLLEVLTS